MAGQGSGSDTRAELWPGAVDGPGTATVPGAAWRALDISSFPFHCRACCEQAARLSLIRLLTLSLMASRLSVFYHMRVEQSELLQLVRSGSGHYILLRERATRYLCGRNWLIDKNEIGTFYPAAQNVF